MTTVMDEAGVFVADYDRREGALGAGLPPWMRRLRRAAIARFAEMGLPTTKHEEWRFTDLSPLAETAFESDVPSSETLSSEQLDAAGLPRLDGPRLVLVDGHVCDALSSLDAVPDGVTLDGIARILRTRPELAEPHLGRHAEFRDHAPVAINAALFEDGALVRVHPDVAVEQPIQLVHVSTGGPRPRAAYPRHLIVIGRRAKAAVFEAYLGLGDGVSLTDAVTEIVVEEGATLDHYKLQREGPGAFHLSTVDARQERASAFFSHLIALGGRLARHETNARLAGEDCQTVLDGLYIGRGEQHLDSRTRIDHAQPHCDSRELYKGILHDRAHGVFNGKIFVHQDAQKTDAKQVNQALLLSDRATINTKPQLEIFADDVKCTHGATVGQLEAEALFYLRSRGIPLDQARDVLIYAFANDVLARMNVKSIRATLERILWAGQSTTCATDATAIP